ncbi:MAG: autotransporter outer membrane beta-barrel domain-containing protein [bacterium]|nr:autotransporter outer membrane beta-barrel domain-containing protein [bacterium]
MKNKTYIIAVLFAVVFFISLPNWADNYYTEKRNMFIGGYVEFSNSTWKYVYETIETKNNSFTIDMNIGWFLKNNLAVGLKLGYGHSASDERHTSGSLEYYHTVNTFRVGAFMRNYFRLVKNVKFFIETSVVGGFGGIKYRTISDIAGTTTADGNSFSFEAGFRPGVVFFIGNGVAVEATVGFLGFTYSKQKTGDEPLNTEATSSDLDFSFNFNSLKIQFGIAIYL